MPKTLFFAPHAAIWHHAFPEALVAEALRDSGHEIVYVTCGRLFDTYCVSMSAYGVGAGASPEAKTEICRRCRSQSRVLREEFGFAGYDLGDRLSPTEREEARRVIEGLSPEHAIDFTRDGFAIGKVALYQFLLEHKKITLTFSEADWHGYRIELLNTLYAYLGAKKVLESERPDFVCLYNGLYSVNRMFAQVAERRGIPVYFLHGGSNLSDRLQRMMMGRRDTFTWFKRNAAHWPRFRDVPISSESLAYVTEHYLELFRGRNVFAYSAASAHEKPNVREYFGVRPDQKLLVAAMSSYDERFAAESVGAIDAPETLLFKLQSDWIQALITYVKERPELFLVIRVHPREFPNKREGVKSEHAKLLEDLFQELPPNARVNWPADQLSLYDLAEYTDVFLSAWSSVGKEMTLLGLPVVLYSDEMIWYPADLNYLGTTHDGYFQKIEQALADGWSFERIRQSYRWQALEMERAVLDLRESSHIVENESVSLPERIRRRLIRSVAPMLPLRQQCRRRKRPLAVAPLIGKLLQDEATCLLDVLPDPVPSQSLEAETQAIKRELARLVEALYGPSPVAGGDGLRSRLLACLSAEEVPHVDCPA